MSMLELKTWHERAVCGRETPDVSELWTSDSKPKNDVFVHLEQMCLRCPVRLECAAQALEDDAEAGTYAGVHVPPRCRRARWAAARDKLQSICAGDSVDVPEGVPA